MQCPVLTSLSSSVAAVERLAVPVGLGADVVLGEQVHALAEAIARLQRGLAIRMAAHERVEPRTSDVTGAALRAGLDGRGARKLRRLGRFVDEHPEVERRWLSGSIRVEQVELLCAGAGKVGGRRRWDLVSEVLPLLPGLDEKATRQVVQFAVDHLAPGDPDHEEVSDHAARRLAWSRVAEGGLAFEGYLPATEGAAFTTAIDALVESLRVAGDGLTGPQRRADALATLVASATQHGLPTGGGLPAAMTLTVSLTEATRVALRDPARHASRIRLRPRGGSALDGQLVGDATVRFGMCCAAVTPILTGHAGSSAELPGTTDGPEATRRRAGASERPADPHRPAPDWLADAAGRPAADEERRPTVGSLMDRLANTPVQPLAVGRSVRLATPAQRQALRIRDGGCAIPGCAVDAAYTQPHHVVGWAVGGSTDLDGLVSLCWVHHRMTELGRFRFVTRDGDGPQPTGALAHSLWWILPPTASCP